MAIRRDDSMRSDGRPRTRNLQAAPRCQQNKITGESNVDFSLKSNSSIEALKGHKANENISFFLQAAQNYGVPSSNLFQTVDLTDGQNMAQVQTGLYNVSELF